MTRASSAFCIALTLGALQQTPARPAAHALIPRYARDPSPIALSGPARPGRYLEASGLRAALLGREDGSFEAWVYPLKVLHGFQLAFGTPAYADPIAGADLATSIDVRPEAATVRYAHDSFTADAIWFVPRDQPGALVLLDVRTSVPLRIVVRFRIDLKPMWPAALGGQYSYWDAEANAYVVGEASRKHAALIGSPLALKPPEQPAHNLPDAPSQFTIAIDADEAARGLVPIAIAASPDGLEAAKTTYARLLTSVEASYHEAAAHYRHVREDLLSIETPDEGMDRAFEWGKVALDKGFVCNPQLGCGLIAGLGPSGTTERPGFGWFFGGDAFINSWAMTAYGDFETVRRTLEFLRERQRADGKMMHELSQGAAYVRWFEDFPYGYYHADTTPLYILAVRDYVRSSGDVAFAKAFWPSIRKAYEYCASTDEDGDGLMDNTKAGLAAVETGTLRSSDVLTDVFLAAAWTEAAAAAAELAAIAGDSFADAARRRFDQARASLNKRFAADAQPIAFAILKNGRPQAEETVWPAFGLWRGVFDDSAAVQKTLDDLASAGIAADWGARMLSRNSGLYEPLSYNNGAVWPFLSGFAMLALYAHHRPDAAWQYLDATAGLTFLESRGYIAELFSGDRLRSIDAAVPHQLFATTGFMSGFMRGLVGLREPPAGDASAPLTLEPQLPAEWRFLRLRRLRWRDAIFDVGFTRREDGFEATVDNRGASRPLLVKVAPGPGSQPAAGELRFAGTGTETKSLTVQPGIEIAAVNVPMVLGDPPQRLRIISTSFANGRYTARLQGLRERTYIVRLKVPFRIESVSGGEVVRSGEWTDVKVTFPAGQGDWAEQALSIPVGPRLTRTAALFNGSSHGAEPIRLTTQHITAEFDDRGLVSIRDGDAGAYSLPRDDFEITLDGNEMSSRSLSAPSRAAAADRVTFSWAIGAYHIDVVYEVHPEWRFVSKQLIVRGSPASFRVGIIRPIDADLGEPVEADFVPQSARRSLGTGDYGIFLRLGARGLLGTVQNPFLVSARRGQTFSIQYDADIEWRSSYGVFTSDRALLAPYRLTGHPLPERMMPEWAAGPEISRAGADQAEVAAFTECVRAFLLYRPARPLNVFVGWCVNDYQIDVATPGGRAEYKRVIDRAAELGAEYVLYAPSNSALSRRELSADDWSWEHVLWLGLGQKLRKGEWDPRRDPLPSSVREMVDYARSKNIRLLAYVYPVLPFSGNSEWLVSSSAKPDRRYASLGVRSWQDHLIDLLVAFHDRAGIGGFAFDHTFLNYPGTSRYAQWAGWRRVIEEVRRRIPDAAIDGRQAYHLYGPWSWLAGSYPHPTFNDEQPESFVPFPDLHFDRVSANRERYTAYRYRNYEFAPSEIVPGFMTHQTPRNDDTGEMPQTHTPDRGVVPTSFRTRDWDYLGWRYSVLSSIAIGGWNNVINMIPARDLDEATHFSEADKQWLRRWIEWTRTNQEFLRHTQTILGEPGIGRIDGTAAIVGDRGFVFLFNPNARRLKAAFTLADIGMSGSPFLVRELHPLEGRLIGRPWSANDRIEIEMDGQSALVVEVSRAGERHTTPLLFGIQGTVSLEGDVLRITDARGEVGTTAAMTVWLPDDRRLAALQVNGHVIPFSNTGNLVSATVRFAGALFRHAQPIIEAPDRFEGGVLKTTTTIPRRVITQLQARRKAWPIPWTPDDLKTTWLAPERLLLFVQFAEPDDRWDATLTIDGRAVPLLKAFSSIHPAKSTFVGFYADVSSVSPDEPHAVELGLPRMKPGQFLGAFFENVEPEYTSGIAR